MNKIFLYSIKSSRIFPIIFFFKPLASLLVCAFMACVVLLTISACKAVYIDPTIDYAYNVYHEEDIAREYYYDYDYPLGLLYNKK